MFGLLSTKSKVMNVMNDLIPLGTRHYNFEDTTRDYFNRRNPSLNWAYLLGNESNDPAGITSITNKGSKNLVIPKNQTKLF